EAGHRKSKNEVAKWVLFTIIGGATFLGCQAYEWYHFIIGTSDGAYAAEVSVFEESIVPQKMLEELALVQMMPTYAGEDEHDVTALKVRDGATITNEAHIEKILGEASHTHAGTYLLPKAEAKLLNIPQLETGSDIVVAYPVREENEDIFNTKEKKIIAFRLNNGYQFEDAVLVRDIEASAPVLSAKEIEEMTESEKAAREEIEKWNLTDGGANLYANEYGPAGFADLFFFVTGFHGTHVFSGVVLLVILWLNVIKGTYDRRGHYEMTEKIGLYWHFVDLVWVFVFTFFYLI
ncbi:MAG: cytochrome c oxidase subunit 3, partial [Bacteroidota bacterium]